MPAEVTAHPVALGRVEAVRRGRRLEYFTIAWNSAEAVIALLAGWLAGSIALVGFGLDSLIEVTSGAALLWRLGHEMSSERRERVERTSLRIVGWCFLALALYVAYESVESLWRSEVPERSVPGIFLAIASLVAMPILSRAKRRVAAAINSAAMRADARQTDFCLYLSAILLGGLVLNAWLGWWWADPVAGLAMVPLIAKEGVDALRGKACGCDSACHG
jgi:divalent metal cation (Fe/Co/Zn/Cd) transporter